jgi:hypothetical protein
MKITGTHGISKTVGVTRGIVTLTRWPWYAQVGLGIRRDGEGLEWISETFPFPFCTSVLVPRFHLKEKGKFVKVLFCHLIVDLPLLLQGGNLN